jgi:hypothetical protein
VEESRLPASTFERPLPNRKADIVIGTKLVASEGKNAKLLIVKALLLRRATLGKPFFPRYIASCDFSHLSAGKNLKVSP